MNYEILFIIYISLLLSIIKNFNFLLKKIIVYNDLYLYKSSLID